MDKLGAKPGDPAESAIGDAGKGSFQQSQDAGQGEGGQGEGAAPAKTPNADWHEKLKDEMSGSNAPKEGREDAAGPGRGRF